MSRVVVFIVACAFLVATLGLGKVSAFTGIDGNRAPHHGDRCGPKDIHPSTDGLVAFCSWICFPTVALTAPKTWATSLKADELVWRFFDEQTLHTDLSKQDPPVPRRGA